MIAQLPLGDIQGAEPACLIGLRKESDDDLSVLPSRRPRRNSLDQTLDGFAAVIGDMS
jgi:hypothetical protein